MSRIIFFLLALFSPLSHAFQLSDAMIDAEVVKVNSVVSVDSNGIKVNVTGKGFKASAPYFNTTTVVPKPTFMSFVKGNMKSLVRKSPYYIGWAAAMAAAGWAIDELTGEVKTTVKIGKGTCTQNYVPPRYNVTVEECIKGSPTISGPGAIWDYKSHSVSYGPFPPVLNQATVFTVKITPKGNPNASESATSSFKVDFVLNSEKTEPVTVGDAQLYDSFAQHMLSNPSLSPNAFMSDGPYPYPYPQLFPNPLKYIPGVSEADYPLLDCYFKGTLQSTNPGGACYATQAETDRITALGNQIKVTTGTGGQIEEANDQLSKPLTQAQLEESLNKLGGADVNKVTDDASKIYDSGFKQLNDSIVANTLPGMPDLIPLPQFQTGSCRSITFQFSFAGKSVTKQFPGDLGCVQLEKMKEFLGWLMAIAVTIGLMFAALREAN